MMRDLQDVRLIVVKAVLFVCLGSLSAALLLWPRFEWRQAVLLVIAIWAFCRAYYFAFYVIERYVDPRYKFSGVLSAVRWIATRSGNDVL